MEKTLTIDGRQVTFKSSGALPKRYKMQFARDYFVDMMALKKMGDEVEKAGDDFQDVNLEYFDAFYDIAWTLAKTADSSIPDPMAWLDTFDVFPIVDILPEIQELLMSSLSSNSAKKK